MGARVLIIGNWYKTAQGIWFLGKGPGIGQEARASHVPNASFDRVLSLRHPVARLIMVRDDSHRRRRLTRSPLTSSRTKSDAELKFTSSITASMPRPAITFSLTILMSAMPGAARTLGTALRALSSSAAARAPQHRWLF